MRCLYCGKELALLKRWRGGGDFCSDAHKHSYQEEYNRLALTRLLQAQKKGHPRSAPAPIARVAVEEPETSQAEAVTEAVVTIAAIAATETVAPQGEPRETAGFLPVHLATAAAPEETCRVEGWIELVAGPALAEWQLPSSALSLSSSDLLSLELHFRASSPEPTMPAANWTAEPFTVARAGPASAKVANTRRLPTGGTIAIDIAASPRSLVPDGAFAQALPPENTVLFEDSKLLELSPTAIDFPSEGSDVVVEGPPEPPEEISTPAAEDSKPGPSWQLFEVALKTFPPAKPALIGGEPFPAQPAPLLPHLELLPLRPKVALAHGYIPPPDAATPPPASSSKPVARLAQPKQPAVAKPAEQSSLAAPHVEAAVPTFAAAEPAKLPFLSSIKLKLGIAIVLLVIACTTYLGWGGSSRNSSYSITAFAADASGTSIIAGETGGGGGWMEGWGGDPSGGHSGRKVTIYQPSLKLSDYRLEFEGSIDTKSLGWVFRASDPENYYAMKLTTVGPGNVALFKYVVANGRETQVGSVPTNLTAGPDTIFRIHVDVHGPDFSTYIQGRLIDVWTDGQLKIGGVGFLNEREERGIVKSVSIRYPNEARYAGFTRRNGMEQTNDQWLWFVDSELVDALARTDVLDVESEKRPVQSSTLANALALNMDGKTEQALREIREAIDNGEHLPELVWTKAHLEFQLGHFDNALNDYRKIIETQPNHKAASYNAALCLEKLKRYEEAATVFRKAADLDPQLVEAILGIGVCELHRNNPEIALAAFEECLRAQPGQSKALYGKAVTLHQLGQTAEAMELYQKLLPDNSTDTDLLTNMIHVALARGEHEKARDLSEQLLRLRPNAQAGLTGMIASAMARGDYKTASQLGTQLVKSASSSFEAWFNQGVAYQKINRLEQAGQAYAEALKVKPDSGLAYANMGVILQGRGNLPEARKAYERALQFAPELPAALWNLAIVLDRLGNPSEAEKCIEKLVEVEPEREDAWFRIGYLRLLRGDAAGSLEPFRFCAGQRPEWMEALMNLGVAERHLGNLEGAKDSFARAVARYPESTDALRALAAVAIDQGDYAAALNAEAKLDELGEQIPELSYNIGVLLQKSNLQEDAARSYRRAAEKKPEFAEALLNLGHALQALGREEEARECWQQAVGVKPELAEKYF